MTLIALFEDAVLYMGIFLRTHVANLAWLPLRAVKRCLQLAALIFEVVSLEALEICICFPCVPLLVLFLPGRCMFFMVVVLPDFSQNVETLAS